MTVPVRAQTSSTRYALLAGLSVTLLAILLWQLDRTASHPLAAADCWFEQLEDDAIECAWLTPSLQDVNARTQLPVVVLRGVEAAARRATVLVMGGPGGSSYLENDQTVAYWRVWADRLDIRHDLVLYDQRGTGLATPDLHCAELDRFERGLLDSELSEDAQWQLMEPELLRCASKVAAADRASGLYSTRTAAVDLRELVVELRRQHGYEQVSVYAVSYGTRVASEAFAGHESLIDALVLDSPYPAGVELRLGFAQNFREILDRLDQSLAGSSALPLHQVLTQAMQRIDRERPRLSVYDANTGTHQAIRISPALLLALAEHLLYAAVSAEEFRELLQAAAEGGFATRWHEVLEDWLWVAFDPGFNLLTHVMVECRDNVALTREQEHVALAPFPEWADALSSPPTVFQLCEHLGVQPDPLPPRIVAAPVLVLAADYDPRTPAGPALAALAAYPQLHVLRRPITGHALVDIDGCAAGHAGRFLSGQSTLAPSPALSCQDDSNATEPAVASPATEPE